MWDWALCEKQKGKYGIADTYCLHLLTRWVSWVPKKEVSWHSPFTKSCHETMCKQSLDLEGLNHCMLQCRIILIWNNLSKCRGSNKCQIYETSYLPFDPSWCRCLFCCNEYRQLVCLPVELNISVTESYCTLVNIYKKLSENKTIFLW